jgi:hypothetical protein
MSGGKIGGLIPKYFSVKRPWSVAALSHFISETKYIF